MPDAIKHTAVNIITDEYQIMAKYKWVIVICSLFFLLSFLLRGYLNKNVKQLTVKHAMSGLFSGLVMTVIGLYPYVVIRQNGIETAGMSGRDSLLVCAGIAVMIFCFIELIKLPEWMQQAVILSLAALATLHFTDRYAGYLRDHYEQMALEMAWTQNDNVKNGKTFIYIRQEGEQTVGESYYALNAMAKDVYGDSGRFISCGINDLACILTYDKKEIMRNDATYCYEQYDLSDIKIDGIMLVSYNMSEMDAAKLKFEEILKKNEYYEHLKDYIKYEYISVSDEESAQICEKYAEGVIANDDELLQLIQHKK